MQNQFFRTLASKDLLTSLATTATKQSAAAPISAHFSTQLLVHHFNLLS
jgi:hypothetical protein